MTYGKTHSYYNALGSSYGQKVKERFHCPDCPEREGDIVERNRVYIIPFVGRYITENGNKRYVWKLRPELEEALMSIEKTNPESGKEVATDIGLNTILYGPPGTGKTYHTVYYAVAIIENPKLASVEKEEYSDVLERYNEYKAQGRIEFTTFHQSYGYEEFIEGIRPAVVEEGDQSDAGNIQYSVQPGVFKKFCERADRPAAAGTGSGNWDIRENILAINGGTPMTLASVYKLANIAISDVYKLIEKHQPAMLAPANHKENYVFIIDEINRGNISKIFGELIPLIEASKRVTLLYPRTDKMPAESEIEFKSDDGVTVKVMFVDLFSVSDSIDHIAQQVLTDLS